MHIFEFWFKLLPPSLLMPISACARTSNGLSPAASLFCGNFVLVSSDDQFHRLCFRRWSSPLCCPGWIITVMLRWLAYRPICVIVSNLCSTLLIGRLLDCDDQTTSLTLLPVFTGCVHLNASSLNWQSLSTEIFTALHLGICLICCTAFQTSHLRSSTSSELVIPLSRLVAVGDRSFAVAGPRLWNTLPEDITSAPSLLVFRRKLKTHLFRQSYPDIVS